MQKMVNSDQVSLFFDTFSRSSPICWCLTCVWLVATDKLCCVQPQGCILCLCRQSICIWHHDVEVCHYCTHQGHEQLPGQTRHLHW
jgi:hypothetical protein